MVNLLTGLVGIVLLAVFLGKYALSINAAPLWIIILGSLALAIDDFVGTLRSRDRNEAPNDSR